MSFAKDWYVWENIAQPSPALICTALISFDFNIFKHFGDHRSHFGSHIAQGFDIGDGRATATEWALPCAFMLLDRDLSLFIVVGGRLKHIESIVATSLPSLSLSLSLSRSLSVSLSLSRSHSLSLSLSRVAVVNHLFLEHWRQHGFRFFEECVYDFYDSGDGRRIAASWNERWWVWVAPCETQKQKYSKKHGRSWTGIVGEIWEIQLMKNNFPVLSWQLVKQCEACLKHFRACMQESHRITPLGSWGLCGNNFPRLQTG